MVDPSEGLQMVAHEFVQQICAAKRRRILLWTGLDE